MRGNTRPLLLQYTKDIRTALRSAGGLVRVRRETTMPDKNGPLSGFLKSSQISQHVPARIYKEEVSQDINMSHTISQLKDP